MSEHLDTNRLELFIAHKLPPDELLLAARHIGVCESCRQRIPRAEGTGPRIDNLRAELEQDAKVFHEHLDYEQLAAYVDETLDAVGREIADNHLAVCQPCARELLELELFRAEMTRTVGTPKTAFTLHRGLGLQRLGNPATWLPRMAWAAVLLIAIAAAVLLLWSRGRAPQVTNNNGKVPDVVNSNSSEVTTEIGRHPPNLVNNRNVNANENASNGGPVNRSDPANANRRDTLAGDPNVNPGAGVMTYEAVIKRALETGSLDRAPVLNELAGRPSTLMGRSPNSDLGVTFALLQPVGTVTMGPRPTFSWQPLAGATSYQVHVLDTDFKVVAESGPLTSTSWTLPNALKRGVVYLWQVSAAKDGEIISAPAAPRPEARFTILSVSKTRDVQNALRERAGSHLALGIIYAHTGLLDDAEREFQAALSRNEEAAAARRLLQNLHALRN